LLHRFRMTLTEGSVGHAGAVRVVNPVPEAVGETVARIARGMLSVLISGETGVGKEVLARTIHELSGRAGELVSINCASLSPQLLESELFGHERGAFTGAAGAKRGLFEIAAGGTVFLDEIGELPLSLQARLLRVLETRQAYRVGGLSPVDLDVRFVSATHRDLVAEVARGAFRRDLYFRVNGMALAIPPLRARREAIPALARELLAQVAGSGRRAPRLGATALATLVQHPWPGNVRELRTVMERAVLVCDGDEILPAHLLFDAGAGSAPCAGPPEGSAERQRILAALDACAGNQTRAARLLGMSRSTLVNKLSLLDIPRPRSPRW
jgi:DNA-binding NtrC family response regulator